MAVETLHPTSYTAPAPGAGSAACSATVTTATCDATKSCPSTSLLQKSVAWYPWASATYQADYSSLTLKVVWSMSALTAGMCLGDARLRLEYSTNAGSSWTLFSGFPKNGTLSTQSGTASATLLTSQNLANLRVRAVVEVQIDGVSCPGCSLSLTGSVSDVRTEGNYSPGACCTNGVCTQTTVSQCGGTFVGGSCGSQTCQVTRPCCKPNLTCAILSESACVAAGGTWYPNKSSCSQVNCVSSAGCCIRANGTCETTLQASCNGAGDVWLGANSSCTTAPDGTDCSPCTNVGACCKSDGSCIRATQCWCQHAGGAFRGAGTDCSPSPCGHKIRVVLL